MRYEYRRPTEAELKKLWDSHVAANPGDACWERWRTQFLSDNREGRAVTFAVMCDGEAVGEGTLLLSPLCRAVRGRTLLCDGACVANLNALRIGAAHEGQGHISALVREIEAYAVSCGIHRITIGVEEGEARTRAIYRHLGYTVPLFSECEGGETVLYYAKDLGDD